MFKYFQTILLCRVGELAGGHEVQRRSEEKHQLNVVIIIHIMYCFKINEKGGCIVTPSTQEAKGTHIILVLFALFAPLHKNTMAQVP